MHIEFEEAAIFLSKKFKHVMHLQHLAEGWWAQAFSFSSEKGKFVLRISAHPQDFSKDKFAYENFNSTTVPIARILETGQFNQEFHYCLSAFCEGVTADKLLAKLDHETASAIVPSILQPLYHIHQLDTSQLTGWGLTDHHGNGGWKSWPEYLSSMFNQKYRVSWQELGRTSWLDPVLFNRLHNRMQELFQYLPKEKNVLHGDYGYDNLLLNTGHQPTAVLDWGEMLLGDELYDLIHMNEPWNTENTTISYLSCWKKEMEAQQIEIVHFDQRLECYHIHYALFHLHMHTARLEEEDYHHIARWAERELL